MILGLLGFALGLLPPGIAFVPKELPLILVGAFVRVGAVWTPSRRRLRAQGNADSPITLIAYDDAVLARRAFAVLRTDSVPHGIELYMTIRKLRKN